MIDRHPRPAQRPALAAFAASALACALAGAAAAEPEGSNYRAHPRLNDTGLVRCTRDSMHWDQDCTGTGQDAASGRDATDRANGDGHGGFAFRKVCNSGEFAGIGACTRDAPLGSGADDWGCTYDKVTGLLWEMKQADGGLHDVSGRYRNLGDHGIGDASAFVDDVNAQGLCGASDWRLPTTYELQGIVDFDRASPQPSIDQRFFPNSLAAHYWASEAYVGQEAITAWIVSFVMDPKNVNVAGWARSDTLPARLVRQARPPAALPARFRATARGDEIVDTREHLVWRRCTEGQAWNGGTCTGSTANYSFQNALAHAAAVAGASGLPWRVPNAKELHSIVDHARSGPAIDPEIFPRTPAELSWTSTAYAWTATGGWAVNFGDGGVLAYYNGFEEHVRLVRDAD